MTQMRQLVQRLASMPVEIRAVAGACDSVLLARPQLRAKTWAALRGGPCGGIGHPPIKKFVPLAFAAGQAFATARRQAASWKADAWRQGTPGRARGAASVPEVTEVAGRVLVTPSGLQRAARRLGAVRTKTGRTRGWVWALLGAADAPPAPSIDAREGGQVVIEGPVDAAGRRRAS